MTEFFGKKIAILGLGLEGGDLCQFLLKKGAKITVFDQKKASELGGTYKKFKNQGIIFKLGKDYLKDGLVGFDFLFRSPGFSRYLPQIVEAEKKGTFISSATKLFFDLCPGKIIGVTGTKGKGTTATLIYEILKENGKKVELAGNIGQPMLSLLSKLTKDHWVVLELSSFQLMDMNKSPHIAVVLFIASEHLDYHKSQEEYLQAKAHLVSFQKEDDFAVLNADNPTSCSFASLTRAKTFYFSRRGRVDGAYVKNGKIFLFNKLVGPVDKLQLRGQHNWENVCAAITTAFLSGAESVKKAVFSFKGLAYRLEFVKMVGGISFYNDSFSTNPEATIAAIRSFSEPLVLIAGGSEKGADYTALGREIVSSSVKTLILIGKMAPRIKEASLKAGYQGKIIYRPPSMKEIVKLAFQNAGSGGIVLLSPAAASLDMFKNYKDRGAQFKKYVQALKTEKSSSQDCSR